MIGRIPPLYWACATVACFLILSLAVFKSLSADQRARIYISAADDDDGILLAPAQNKESISSSKPILTSTSIIPTTTTIQQIDGYDREAEEAEEAENRPLILYAYHETPNARQNAEFFLAHGLHAEADFIFILNGNTTLASSIPTDNHKNIKVIQRENTCFDLGAHAEVLSRNGGELIKSYKRFILMNASIRGPFLPTWSQECWSDALLAKITDTNKLVGMSFNCQPKHHIQSMIFGTDRTGLLLFLPQIQTCFQTLDSAVGGETSCTSAVMDRGFNVTALMTAFSADKDYANTCDHGDLLYDGHYYGITIHPYETMFQKANRDLAPLQLEKLTEWHSKAGYESWGVCKRARNVRRAVREMRARGVDLDFGI
ncbi:hypothetical protein TWF730_007062 [Orbilia blumenaviensis]|uniref:Uncharacterized protein n=1 Tax=Orbilia blumenaviensis TaxID=1796055 RepID=A0AAV9VHK1_9PEZI